MATSKTRGGQESLILEIEHFKNELECSTFYLYFLTELQSSRLSKHIQKILGSELKMQMVIYGIGSLLSEYKCSILQLCLAKLLRKHVDWIGEIEVFDPILTSSEIEVLELMGCSVLKHNEEARRKAIKPTLFFMPHCDLQLYNNLLEANWEPSLLRNVVIFGNSLKSYIDSFLPEYARDLSSSDSRRKLSFLKLMGHILAAETFTDEIEMGIISYDGMSSISYREGRTHDVASKLLERDYQRSFSNLSWHFFSRPLKETRIGRHIREELGLGVSTKEERNYSDKKKKKKKRIRRRTKT